MAVTYALTNQKLSVMGNNRYISGTLTATGTYTTGGDAVTAATLGMHTISDFDITTAINSTPTQFVARPSYTPPTTSVLIQYYGTNAVPGAAVADPQLTSATSITGYAFQFTALGT
jgi:hypothetical protein